MQKAWTYYISLHAENSKDALVKIYKMFFMETDDGNDEKIEWDINNNYHIEWCIYLDVYKTKVVLNKYL